MNSACLNCGATLIGSHCHQCGQAAHVHRTLGADPAFGAIYLAVVRLAAPRAALRPGVFVTCSLCFVMLMVAVGA